MKIWNRELAEHLLTLALAEWGFDFNIPHKFIRTGSNMLFALGEDPGYYIRISKPNIDLEAANMRHKFVEALAETGLPMIKPVKECPPLTLNGCFITAWHPEDEVPQKKIDWAEFGTLLKNFQDAAATIDIDLPPFDPYKKIRERLDDIKERNLLSAEDLAYFEAQYEDLKDRYKEFKSALGEGIIHGDAHIKNAIQTANQLVLCDFDDIGTAPREYDLVMSAVGAMRFNDDAKMNITMQSYEAMAKAFGYDILQDPQVDVLLRTRELTMMSWLIQNAGQEERIDREIAHRLDTIRAGNRYAPWHAM